MRDVQHPSNINRLCEENNGTKAMDDTMELFQKGKVGEASGRGFFMILTYSMRSGAVTFW